MGMRPAKIVGCSVCCRSLYHGRLLVHIFDLVANPAVTIVRAASDIFAGIRPVDVPGFLVAQFAGAMLLFRWLAPSLPNEASNVVVAHSQRETTHAR